MSRMPKIRQPRWNGYIHFKKDVSSLQETCKLSKLNQDELEILNRPNTNEIEAVI